MRANWNRPGRGQGRAARFPGPWRNFPNAGDLPIFALDWTNGTTARDGTTPTTATRTSSAYRTDWDGTTHIQTLVSSDVIRIGSYYDGLASRFCAQIEGGSANSSLHTEDASNPGAWSTATGTPSFSDSGVASGLDAKNYQRITSTGEAVRVQTLAVTASTQYVVSLFVREMSSFAGIGIGDGTSDYHELAVNLTDQTKGTFSTASATTNVGTLDRTDVQPRWGGGYRISLTYTTAVGVTSIQIRLINGLNSTSSRTFAGVSQSFDYIGFQHEPGVFPTSYIPTTSAAATRADDALVYTMPTLLGPPYTLDAYTYLAHNIVSTTQTSVAIHDASGGANDRAFLTLGGINLERWVVGNVAFINTSPAIGSWVRRTGTAAIDDMTYFVDGSSVGTDTAGTPPNDLDTLTVGSQENLTAPYQHGFVGPIKIFNKVVTP